MNITTIDLINFMKDELYHASTSQRKRMIKAIIEKLQEQVKEA